MFGLSAFAQAPFASLGTQAGPDTIVNVATNVGVMSAGTVVVSAGARIHEDISGLQATTSVGTTTFTATTTPPITGVSAIGGIGNLENTAGAVVSVTNGFYRNYYRSYSSRKCSCIWWLSSRSFKFW